MPSGKLFNFDALPDDSEVCPFKIAQCTPIKLLPMIVVMLQGIPSLSNPEEFGIWRKHHIAFLKDDYGFLSSTQQELYALQPLSFHPNAPQSDSEWKELNSDLHILSEHFSIITTYQREIEKDHQSTLHRSVDVRTFACPLLLPPIPELDANDDRKLVSIVLGKISIPKHLREFYSIQARISFDNGWELVNMLCGIPDNAQFPDMVFDLLQDGSREDTEENLVGVGKDNGMVEVVHIGILRTNEWDYNTEDGWVGNFCDVYLCRRNEAGKRVLGWIMYRQYDL